MGLSTALIGVLPTYATFGLGSTALLVSLRLMQGLALGGEYGGAATYVAVHVPDKQRGYYTSFIQTTATLGFFLSMVVIASTRSIAWQTSYLVVAIALALAALLFVFFVWLSDRIGRKKIMLAGCARAALSSTWAKEPFGTGAIYTGLLYPTGVCVITLIVGGLFIRETKDHKIDTDLHPLIRTRSRATPRGHGLWRARRFG